MLRKYLFFALTVRARWMLSAALLSLAIMPLFAAEPQPKQHREILCKERFKGHIQGIAADENGIFWSFYDMILKTDWNGRKIIAAPVPPHAGDLCLKDGKLYVSVVYYNIKRIRQEGGSGWVYEYDSNLKFLKKHALPDTPRPDGITFYKGKFFIAGDDYGKEPHMENTISVYGPDLKFQNKISVNVGIPTDFGVQTLNVFGDQILAGFYTRGKCSFFLDPTTLKQAGSFPQNISVGMACVPKKISGNDQTILIARTFGKKNDYGAKLAVFRYEKGKLIPVSISVMK